VLEVEFGAGLPGGAAKLLMGQVNHLGVAFGGKAV
jgi:hypothetical protein